MIEPEATRDHTERMLGHFGAEVTATERRRRARDHRARAMPSSRAAASAVPGDPSSAAFLAAAALIVPRSEVRSKACSSIRPAPASTRRSERWVPTSIFHNEREQGGEPVADIAVRHSKLKGVRVPPERAPSMIDEYPVLACLAAYAAGETHMAGLAELKVKESDRLAATAAGLRANGVRARSTGIASCVEGGKGVRGGGTVETHLDHRIAMAFLTLGLAADRPVTVDDAGMIATSFPEFRAPHARAWCMLGRSRRMSGDDHRH